MCAAKQDLPGLEFVINIAAAAAFFSQFWVCRYPANCLLGTIDFILKGVIIKKMFPGTYLLSLTTSFNATQS